MDAVLLVLSACLLAYANGANDNFKGVATLYGCDALSYRAAIRWGTLCTFLGSLCSIVLAQSLLIAFSGKGLVPDAITGSSPFLVSVALGAGFTVMLATFTGLPVSTTHSLVGGLVGAGTAAAMGAVDTGELLGTFLLPLILSPAIAVALGAALYLLLRFIRLRTGVSKNWCLCVGTPQEVRIPSGPESLLALAAAPPELAVHLDETQRCEQRYAGAFFGVRVQQLVDATHVLSAGVVSFARGLNDTPKIAALLLMVNLLDIRWGLLAVAAAIAAGGLLSATRVGETMGHRITDMNHGQAVSANLATGALVIVASNFGLPVSTTHVSVGTLFGIGMVTRRGHALMIRTIVLAWVVTLPLAAAIAAAVYLPLMASLG
jgi:PiT family inorganic phosphate transporter